MIERILELLEIAKKNKLTGRYIDVALGKYKYPERYTEAVELLRRELWKKDK